MNHVGPAAVAPIPADGLLLHIGVFKTGTTALQETLRHSPGVLTASDVLYRGPHSWQFAPLRNLARAGAPQWESLVGEVAAHTGRAVVSSENLCGCSDDEAATVVAALGGQRPVRILITVRALAELLPSTWQQLLKRGMSHPYDEWVAKVVADAPAGDGLFWRRNNFPEQVRRWGDLVGGSNVTVVVSDKRQPDRLLRVTEQLLALPEQSLQFTAEGKSNESLSHAEAELLRRVNAATFGKLGEADYHRLVRLGVFPAMHRAQQAKAAPIPLPAGAADEMGRIGREQAEVLRAAAATIVGDIDDLGRTGGQSGEDAASPSSISIDTAAAAVIGALIAATRTRSTGPAPAHQPRPGRRSRWRGLLRGRRG